MTVEELAQTNDLPAWKVAETLVKLMRKGMVAVPGNATVNDHAAWLMTTYPKPQNVIGENAKPTATPYQRGHDAACRSGEYLGIDHLADDPMAACPYPDDTAEAIDWLDGYRDGARAMDEAWSRYD